MLLYIHKPTDKVQVIKGVSQQTCILVTRILVTFKAFSFVLHMYIIPDSIGVRNNLF